MEFATMTRDLHSLNQMARTTSRLHIRDLEWFGLFTIRTTGYIPKFPFWRFHSDGSFQQIQWLLDSKTNGYDFVIAFNSPKIITHIFSYSPTEPVGPTMDLWIKSHRVHSLINDSHSLLDSSLSECIHVNNQRPLQLNHFDDILWRI